MLIFSDAPPSAWSVQLLRVMSIERTQNTINPQHLVTPARTTVPMPKPFDAPPGVMPYHRMLEAQNALNTNAQTPDQTFVQAPIARDQDSFEPSKPWLSTPMGLLPKLGELTPITPEPKIQTKIVQTQQVQSPATGRVFDIYG